MKISFLSGLVAAARRLLRVLAWVAPVLTAGAGPVAADRDKLVEANSGFAFGLMTQITAVDPSANVFISPYSVSSALQMTAAGAVGQTRVELQQVLKTGGLDATALPAAVRDLDRELAGRKEVTLNLANGLWFEKGFHLKPAFVDCNRQFFQAALEGVDFGTPGAADVINNWADRQTHGKIQQVVSYPFPPRTRLVLANAIYFKGQWVDPFKKNLTQPRAFHLADGQSQDTPMMKQGGSFQYQEAADFQAVRLPYRGGLEMELYLPAAGSSPRQLLGEWADRRKFASSFASREGMVVLPKFKMNYQVLLNEPLKALGLRSAFGDGANFSGIADEKTCISQVCQKSYVDVDEEGTEAAAVTTVQMTSLAMRRPPPNRFSMILDRPFFFVISDTGTGSVLFLGIVNHPAAGS